MERFQVLVLPVELEEGKVLDAVCMVELVSQHRVARFLLLDVGDGLVGLRVRI